MLRGNQEKALSVINRRGLMFGLGATTVAGAIAAINKQALAEPLRQYLLAQVRTGAPTAECMLSAKVYQPLADQLNVQFSDQYLVTTVKALRAKCGRDLEAYKFGGFVADPKDDGNNKYPIDPEMFRKDMARFPANEVTEFEKAMRENCAATNGLMWPIQFDVNKWDFSDGYSHFHMTKDWSGAKLWHCYVICRED